MLKFNGPVSQILSHIFACRTNKKKRFGFSVMAAYFLIHHYREAIQLQCTRGWVNELAMLTTFTKQGLDIVRVPWKEYTYVLVCSFSSTFSLSILLCPTHMINMKYLSNIPVGYGSHSELKFHDWQTVIYPHRLIYPRVERLSGFHEKITLTCACMGK